jgi:DNA-binding IclR family transcriptional regulator
VNAESTSTPLYGAVLLKAKEIMDFIARTETPPTLKEISLGVAISKPTVFKILQTLTYCGFVRREGSEKQYYLGTVFLEYADKAATTFDIKAVAQPYLTKLRNSTNETINLGIVEDNTITLLEKLESPTSVKLVSRVGGKMNMYSSAMGKTILASYTEEKLNDYLIKTPLRALTPNTITDQKKLRSSLKQIQQQGYAIEDAENQLDIICVGFPLIKRGKIYGAFSVSAPSYRVSQDDLQKFIQTGQATQNAILNTL